MTRVAAGAFGMAAVATTAFGQATFAPNTDPAYIALVEDAFRESMLGGQRFVSGTRWTLDNRRTVAYSFVQDGVTIPVQAGIPGDGPGNSALFSILDGAFDDGNEMTDDRATWQDLVDGAFDRWEDVAGVNFEFRRRLVPVDPDDDPSFDNWDDSMNWADDGPLGGNTAAERGDIRIGMRGIDGPGGILGYSPGPGGDGNIILDAAEDWAQVSGADLFLFFDGAFARVIGNAIGLLGVCPDDGTKLMEPALALGIIGPRHDDIRGAHLLYGDAFEPNNARTIESATLVFTGADTIYTDLSIDDMADRDVFRFNYLSSGSDLRVFVSVTPVGFSYAEGPIVAGVCQASVINSQALFDLRVGAFDSGGNALLPPEETDAEGFRDANGLGDDEAFSVAVADSGDYYIEVRGTGASGEPQLYDIGVSFERTIQGPGFGYGELATNGGIGPGATPYIPQPQPPPFPDIGPGGNLGPIGHGGEAFYDAAATEGGPYTGTRVKVGVLDSGAPLKQHLVFLGKAVDQIAWPGVQPALDVERQHGTTVAGAAVGLAFGSGGDDSFRGQAFGADLAAASVATFVHPTSEDLFLVGQESLYYGLWGLGDPDTAAAVGVGEPVDVLVAPFGYYGDVRGEGPIAHAFDAFVSMKGVSSVVPVGNFGHIDNTDECGGPGDGGEGGPAPGGRFVGARMIIAPATGYNNISVGMVGKALPPNPAPATLPIPTFIGGDDLSPLNPSNIQLHHLASHAARQEASVQRGIGIPDAYPDLPLDLVPRFSSKGPIDSFDYTTGEVLEESRPGIDILAGGAGFILEGPLEDDEDRFPQEICFHPGNVLVGGFGDGLRLPTIDPLAPTNADFSNQVGTSIAAGGVAGGVALLLDVAEANGYPSFPPLMKSVLLTGAFKLAGWTNNDAEPAKPQDNRDGDDQADAVIVAATEQVLDWAQGAGVMDLVQSYAVLHRGRPEALIAGPCQIPAADITTDVPETDPTVPTIRTPDEPAAPSFPGSGTGNATRPDGDDGGDGEERHPPSLLYIANRLRQASDDHNANVLMRGFDFNDPDLNPVGSNKPSGVGVPFDARAPFRPPVGNRGSNFPLPVNPPDPAEVDVLRVKPIGWDHAMIGQRPIRGLPTEGNEDPDQGAIRSGWIDYLIETPLLEQGDAITTTLCWLRTTEVREPDFDNLDDPRVGELVALELENLDLAIVPSDIFGVPLAGNLSRLASAIAVSISPTNTTEHLPWGTPQPGFFIIRVVWQNTVYDLFDTDFDGSVEYAVSWYSSQFVCDPGPTLTSIFSEQEATEALTRLMTSFGSKRTTNLGTTGATGDLGRSSYDAGVDFQFDGRINAADLSWLLDHWPGG